MYAVAMYWEGGLLKMSELTAMTPSGGGWTLPPLTSQVFYERGGHLLKLAKEAIDDPPVRLQLHHWGVVAIWVDHDPVACLAFAQGYFSGFATGVTRSRYVHATWQTPSLN